MPTLTRRLEQIEGQLAGWRGRAIEYRNAATGSGLTAYDAVNLRNDLVAVVAMIDNIPTSFAAALQAKAEIEWGYQRPDLVADLVSFRSACVAAGDRVALADTAIWQGFAIDNAYPWEVTIPSSTDATLATRIQDIIDALDVIRGAIV